MDFNLYQVVLPLIFILSLFGLGYYQKRRKNPQKRLKLVVSRDTAAGRSAETGKTFERHLKSVKPPVKSE